MSTLKNRLEKLIRQPSKNNAEFARLTGVGHPSSGKTTLRREWLLRHNPEKDMFVLHVASNSISPISDGSIALFREQQLERPRTYTLRHENVQLRFRHLELVSKRISVLSDNAFYPPEQFFTKDVKVLGRAIWAGGEL